MIAFARMLGPEARLVPLRLRTEGAAHVKAWATEVAGGLLHVILINKGANSVRVRLALPATGSASVQRLLAAAHYYG